MNNQQHPITPPPSELVLQWIGEYFGCTAGGELSDSEKFLTARAAQWGADHELEACCEWLEQKGFAFVDEIRAVRRPKPPSLKEQALAELAEWENICNIAPDSPIRRALEQLDD